MVKAELTERMMEVLRALPLKDRALIVALLSHEEDPCEDATCSCWTAGHERAVETVGEWNRPIGH
mgnify:FL=1